MHKFLNFLIVLQSASGLSGVQNESFPCLVNCDNDKMHSKAVRGWWFGIRRSRVF